MEFKEKELGISVYLQCHKKRAINHFTKWLDKYPDDFECFMYRGSCYEVLGKKENACSDYDNAKSKGNVCECEVAEGLNLRINGKLEEASFVFEEATKTFPSEAIGWHFHGLDRFNQGLYDEVTIAALQKAIKLNYRRSAVTHYFLGLLFDKIGAIEESITHFKIAIVQQPTFTLSHIALGEGLLKTGLYEEASQQFHEAENLNDTQCMENAGLALVYIHKGNEEAAIIEGAIAIEKAESSERNSGGNRAQAAASTSGGGGDSSGSSDESSSDDEECLLPAETHQPVDHEMDTKPRRKAFGRAEYFMGPGKKKTIFQVKIRREFRWVSFDPTGDRDRLINVWKGENKRGKISDMTLESSYKLTIGKFGKIENNQKEGYIIKRDQFIIDPDQPTAKTRTTRYACRNYQCTTCIYKYNEGKDIKQEHSLNLPLEFTPSQSSRCGESQCKTCKHVKTDKVVTSTTTGLSYVIEPHTEICNVSFVIYLLECKHCKMQYVGKTKRVVSARFGEHLRDVKHGHKKSVSNHFNLPGHSSDDLTVTVLEQVKDTCKSKLKEREKYWIETMGTLHPNGLNRQVPTCDPSE